MCRHAPHHQGLRQHGLGALHWVYEPCSVHDLPSRFGEGIEGVDIDAPRKSLAVPEQNGGAKRGVVVVIVVCLGETFRRLGIQAIVDVRSVDPDQNDLPSSFDRDLVGRRVWNIGHVDCFRRGSGDLRRQRFLFGYFRLRRAWTDSRHSQPQSGNRSDSSQHLQTTHFEAPVSNQVRLCTSFNVLYDACLVMPKL
jgi:hypothetical protein